MRGCDGAGIADFGAGICALPRIADTAPAHRRW
jgi:hypothetical protein